MREMWSLRFLDLCQDLTSKVCKKCRVAQRKRRKKRAFPKAHLKQGLTSHREGRLRAAGPGWAATQLVSLLGSGGPALGLLTSQNALLGYWETLVLQTGGMQTGQCTMQSRTNTHVRLLEERLVSCRHEIRALRVKNDIYLWKTEEVIFLIYLT